MKFAIEAWATEYGSPMDLDPREFSEAKIDVTVERPEKDWAPITPPADWTRPERILFTDGVRRIDARVWIEAADGSTRPGVCASYAAGAIVCDGRATMAGAVVERGLFSASTDASAIDCRHASYGVRRAKGDTPEELWIAIQERMAELEATLADSPAVDLVIVDGPLKGHLETVRRVGYVKTHHVSYLPDGLSGVVTALEPGQRTPIFLTLGRWGRFTWYARLPGATGHSWAGIVRCESTADADINDVIDLADTVTAVLPRYASAPHKDPRAPQNLYPIAGLERELRRRLGDPALLYRDLRVAAARAG